MVTEIGIIGGEILSCLDKNGIMQIEKVVEKIDKPEPLILMSLGWLARENLVVITQSKNKYFTTLKKKTDKMKTAIALPITLGVIIVITVLALAAINLMRQQARVTEHHIQRKRAIATAQAGIVHAYEGIARQLPPYDSLPANESIAVGGRNVQIFVLNPGGNALGGRIQCPANAPSRFCIHAHVSY